MYLRILLNNKNIYIYNAYKLNGQYNKKLNIFNKLTIIITY